MQRIRSFLLSCTLLAASSLVSAQVTPILGSGCPGAPAVVTTGNPSIGGRMLFEWRCGRDEVPVLMFGEVLRPMVSLPTSLTCTRVACTLAVRPLVVIPGSPNALLSVPVLIPNDPSLIGGIAGVQGLCISRQPLCITLGQAIAVRITR